MRSTHAVWPRCGGSACAVPCSVAPPLWRQATHSTMQCGPVVAAAHGQYHAAWPRCGGSIGTRPHCSAMERAASPGGAALAACCLLGSGQSRGGAKQGCGTRERQRGPAIAQA
eukprot:360016-Chlamydomonas_euryale.AAC.2